jgi:glycosyltransferase involved in cell wall biosynthesis
LKKKRYLKTLKVADAVVCPSGYMIDALKLYDIDSILIENVVNGDEYHFNFKEIFQPRILWMRTLEDIYNPLMAVRVLSSLKKKYTDASMVMAGYDRGMMRQTKIFASSLGLSDSIIFPGYITNYEKNQFAKNYDIYICTNKIDNAPISFVEMMLLGLPIVSVNSGGIPYMIEDGINGLLVNDDDHEAMTEKIDELIQHPSKARYLVENAKLSASIFCEGPVLAKWKHLLDKLNA